VTECEEEMCRGLEDCGQRLLLIFPDPQPSPWEAKEGVLRFHLPTAAKDIEVPGECAIGQHEIIHAVPVIVPTQAVYQSLVHAWQGDHCGKKGCPGVSPHSLLGLHRQAGGPTAPQADLLSPRSV
jgi:hypothetical protein